MEQCLARDAAYFDIGEEPIGSDTIVSTFVNFPEYRTHPLVRAHQGSDVSVAPAGLYSDGVSVEIDPYRDTLYAVYVYFPHRPLAETDKPGSAFVYTVHRKTDCSEDTLKDIWSVLSWELQALQHGRKPVLGQDMRQLSDC